MNQANLEEIGQRRLCAKIGQGLARWRYLARFYKNYNCGAMFPDGLGPGSPNVTKALSDRNDGSIWYCLKMADLKERTVYPRACRELSE